MVLNKQYSNQRRQITYKESKLIKLSPQTQMFESLYLCYHMVYTFNIQSLDCYNLFCKEAQNLIFLPHVHP